MAQAGIAAGLGLLVVVGLAACAADPAPKGVPVPSTAAPSSPQAGGDLSQPLNPAAAATNPLTVTTTGAAEPGRLIGLSRDAVLETLGQPVFVRQDGPAQLWRYPWSECYLEVFLFREQSIYQVTHAELRPRIAAAGAPGGCADRSSVARRSRPAS